MKTIKSIFNPWGQRLLKVALIALLFVPFSLLLSAARSPDDAPPMLALARKSQLAQGNAITSPKAILRYALPIDNEPVRKLQDSLEEISEFLRNRRWSPIGRNISRASRLVNSPEKILASIPPERQPRAEQLLDELKDGVAQIREAVEAQDKEAVWIERGEMLDRVGELEQLMVVGFPFEIPEEYANLPQLKGRATVEMDTNKGKVTIVVDGYRAPINAGNFVDLVERGFYEGLEFLPSQDFVVQVGDPPGAETGFIDPKTKEYRAIPLEVSIQGEDDPIYEMTLEDAGLYLEPLALPFSAYGALALARPADDPNGGSSQVFFFLFDTELTPPGFNLLDGRYSVFGYVVEGKEVLAQLETGDRVNSAKVVAGIENLVQPH
ncbi:MAG: peptidylprolyl isomerase [Cyanobacteriota bacterium]|nr:peptidylprolyl isomerase [Cyanobacteriota bacterium]